MKLIVDIILKYIDSGKRIVIPGLGAFLVKKSTGEVIFSEVLKQDDGVLRDELVKSGMKSVEAAGAINRFVFEVRHTLRSGEMRELEGIGTLSINRLSSKIIFTPVGFQPPVETTKTPPRRVIKPATERVSSSSNAQEQTPSAEAESKVKESNSQEPKASPKGKNQSEKQTSAQTFSGRFYDDDPSLGTLNYSREYNSRSYKRQRSKPKRKVDFVLVVAFVVLLAAIGAICYGFYISSQTSDVNPMLQVWEQIRELYDVVVQFFNSLFD